MDKIEFKNGSIIESIETNNNIRSKRGQDLLNKLLKDLYNKTDKELMQELKEDGIEYTYVGIDDYAKCTSTSSRGFTLDDVYKAMEQLEKLPPIPVEIEIGFIAWEILKNQLNIHVVHDMNKYNTLFGINIVLYKGDEIKFNQIKVKYNNNESKIIDIFEWNCDYENLYKVIYRED